MDTQNTPVHIKLWHREFWMLAFANLFICMSIYMLVPVLPLWLKGEFGASDTQVAMAFGIFAVGLFLLGGICNYLVQKYRRNRVCEVGLVCMIICVLSAKYLSLIVDKQLLQVAAYAICLLLGAIFGLVEMVLSSTLIIDVCESSQRTEANHAASWFGRFAIAFGPMAGILVNRYFGFDIFIVLAIVFDVIALVLISVVKFPFKAPSENYKHFSLDRFFLPQGLGIFFNLALFAAVMGIFMSIVTSFVFYGMLIVGFFFALITQKYVFVNADLKSEIVTGTILLLFALFVMHAPHKVANSYLAPALIGMGISLISSRFQLFFIKLSRHCQRGTSQSTYILGLEFGLSVGISIGWAFIHENVRLMFVPILILVVVALILYNIYIHPWYMKNKNR